MDNLDLYAMLAMAVYMVYRLRKQRKAHDAEIRRQRARFNMLRGGTS